MSNTDVHVTCCDCKHVTRRDHMHVTRRDHMHATCRDHMHATHCDHMHVTCHDCMSLCLQNMSIMEIAVELNRLHGLGLKGQLTPADIVGGTFSLSNFGAVSPKVTMSLPFQRCPSP